MRKVTAGLAMMALAVTGCAATATTSSGKPPAAATSHGATTATGTGLGGVTSGGAAGPAQWVVDGTFETGGSPAQPLSGVVTFRDSTTGQTVNVTVGASGKFSLGLIAGTYTATGQIMDQDMACSAPVTVTVRAGELTRVSLVCTAS